MFSSCLLATVYQTLGRHTIPVMDIACSQVACMCPIRFNLRIKEAGRAPGMSVPIPVSLYLNSSNPQETVMHICTFAHHESFPRPGCCTMVSCVCL